MFNNNIGLKRKTKQIAIYIALAIILAYLLLQVLLIGWYQAINFTTQLFTQPADKVVVNIPHAQDTYQNLIRWTFGTEAHTALAIATAENGTHACDRVHVNKDGSKDIGIFQVNTVHAKKGNLYDCRENIRVAYQIYKQSGWGAWVAYQNKSYLKFL